MSILFKDEECCILDHQKYTRVIYNNVHSPLKECRSYRFKGEIFAIADDIKSSPKATKRKKRKVQLLEEASTVKRMFEKALTNIPTEVIDGIEQNAVSLPPTSVRAIAKELFESTSYEHDIYGGNMAPLPIDYDIDEEFFLLPRNSKFFCGDVIKYCKEIECPKYDILVADPPWWNKYIRRLKAANSKLSYSMMHNKEISLIPLQHLFGENCLVAVWCTNSPSNIKAVKDLIFPKWGVEYVTTWYWLKVTTSFKPICEFGSGTKKQPYERIMIGKVGNLKKLPDTQLIISVPSALQSHKPPLLEILKEYVEFEKLEAIELFARSLLPHTTSVGYEPLKWQHVCLYERMNIIPTTEVPKN